MANDKLNDKFFEAMLEAACGEIIEERIVETESGDIAEYEFSPEFEKGIQKLIHTYERKIRVKKIQKTLRRVMSIFVILMAVGFIVAIYFNSKSPNEMADRPIYVPEGFVEDTVLITDMRTQISYINAHDDVIWFYRFLKKGRPYLRLENENLKSQYTVIIGNFTLTVYEGADDEKLCYVVWETNKDFFELHGDVSADELLLMAKSIIAP